MNTLLLGADSTRMFHMLQIKHALALECKGLKHSQGSVYAMVKKKYGLRGNKIRVYKQFCEIFDKYEEEFLKKKGVA